MKFLTDTLAKKLWLTVTAAIFITILYSYALSYLFYEKLYVENVEESLLEEGLALASDYHDGPLTDEFKGHVAWYNTKSETDVFIVNNPRELSACFPFQMNYDSLINGAERDELLKGNPIFKSGYEDRFNGRIMAVIVPLLDESRLEGIIYLYLPLEKISDITKDFAYLWMIAAFLFLIVAMISGTALVKKMTSPLLEMKRAAEQVSKGDYEVSIKNQSQDEIGQLANAFNTMADSIRQEDERKREFLANVSHELRTPISYVKGYSEALKIGLVKNEEDYQKYLELIYREAGRMERLVGDLLDLSKLETEEYQLVKMPIPLAQLIEDSLQKYLPRIKEKGLELEYDLDPEIIINADEGRLEQIIQNIMDNALRYTESGSLSLHLYETEEGCCIELVDSGIGIPAEDLDKIKQRFYRVNKARTRADGGTGLGLAIAEKLVNLHEGELTIESTLGKGTTVRIYLPIIIE
ncbi:sensor histidine kinase [Cytobacillus horneckiae]|uniref:histidine kinase n=1 Tax=Cytobacillus horneckiae TaxID=549687 RepID=A0A2N0ZKT6_9BACI|nr:HAMP domain-containing sensor histidine kinase [Cytobacillus horneckiae]MEC1156340.1 HAMP domain-containing sensor histidine kinase [Cytobacillus horneckiae]MED2938358.1 HAMP domain-containing sensor histidine kinase [Cytobacillus horneckiae]PKG30130.1 sensor histidine kinase [Cytobacillus horneckiae]